MSSFIENLRKAFGNNGGGVQHLSQIPQEQIDQFVRARTDSAEKDYNNFNRRLKISDAKKPNLVSDVDETGFVEDAPRAAAGNTRIYEFEYQTPFEGDDSMGNGEPAYERQTPKRRKGRVLVRVPEGKRATGITPRPDFDVDEFGNPYGQMSVYEAMLDDGQKLSADEFSALFYGNPFRVRTNPRDSEDRDYYSPRFKEISSTKEDGEDSVFELLKEWEDYKESFLDKDDSSEFRWDKRRGVWKKR